MQLAVEVVVVKSPHPPWIQMYKILLRILFLLTNLHLKIKMKYLYKYISFNRIKIYLRIIIKSIFECNLKNFILTYYIIFCDYKTRALV